MTDDDRPAQRTRAMQPSLSFTGLVTSMLVACAAPRPPAPPRPTEAVEELVRVRCATDGRDVVTTWRGRIHGYVPGEPPRLLFGVLGMNVARCDRDARGWYLTSRELMLYLDPVSNHVLHTWANPWTQARVAVVHVANRLVQAHLGTGAPPRQARGETSTYAIDVPLAYPNPLATDPATQALSPQPTYAAIELFTLSAPTAELADPGRPMVSKMELTWHRIGPWLPWMGQGDRPGVLVYSALGQRVASVAELEAPLRAELARVPTFAAAPRCLVDAPNVTSWTYFARHVGAYQRGERFPITSDDPDEACVP